MPKFFKLIFLFVFIGTLHATPLQKSEPPKTGIYITKHSNGKTAEKGYLKNGKKHRIWSFFNENGAIVKKEKWKNNILQWQIFYNERGRIIKTVDKNGNVKELSGCGC